MNLKRWGAAVMTALALMNGPRTFGRWRGSFMGFRPNPQRPRKPRVETRNEFARRKGIPKAFRRHCENHGGDIRDMVRMEKQLNVPMLDNARDRRERRAAQ